MTILEKLREKAIAWVRGASLEQLGALPAEVLGESSAVGSGKRQLRLRTKMKHFMTRDVADKIRAEMSDLKPGTAEYKKKRDQLARSHGFTTRQVANAVNGLSRAANRKKK